jgi:cell division protein FtsI (penicillin-binding protein 3)
MSAFTLPFFRAPAPTITPARPKAKAPVRTQPATDTMRNRITIAMAAFVVVYAVIVGRLIQFANIDTASAGLGVSAQAAVAAIRPDILDANGEIVATDIRTASVYAEPRRIVDADEAAERLATVFPELGTAAMRARLGSDAGFMWLRREITPAQQAAIHALGLPGIGFLTESRRFYPGGGTVGTIVGHVNVDNQGIAGIEKYIDDAWLGDLYASGFAMSGTIEPVRLSMNLRVQHVLNDELSQAMERYHAIGAAGVVMNVNTGEVLAMSSIPDYDPNTPVQALDPERVNRVSASVYEMGSTFKIFTTAMALDSGLVSLHDSFDATRPLRVGGRTINDFHGRNRWLTVPEAFIYSSNIATAREALVVGTQGQQDFLRSLGFMDRLDTELPEVAAPLLPRRWTDLTTVTVAFGHGMSVSPLATAAAASAMVNGGNYMPPTFFPRSETQALALSRRVISEGTSEQMRYLLQLNSVPPGSGSRASVPGYRVGGKTGTAEKVVDGRYVSNKRLNTYIAVFPIEDPQYLVLVTLDEPGPERPGIGATAGLNAAPTAGAVIGRIAPMLGVQPNFDIQDVPLLTP